MTYPMPEVAGYIAANFVPLRVMLHRREDWPFFRKYSVLWTPTVAFLDRNGALRYASPGFLPPNDFLSILKIGRAHCLMAWTRSREAAEELTSAAELPGSFDPEALYWLGVALYLERRDSAGMWSAWDRLVAQYPGSPWAHRVYPHLPGPP